jgi:hypothetical protein
MIQAKVVKASFQALSWHLLEALRKNHKKPNSAEQPGLVLRSEHVRVVVV